MGNQSPGRPEGRVLVPPEFHRRSDVWDTFTRTPFRHRFCQRELEELTRLMGYQGCRLDFAMHPEGGGEAAAVEDQTLSVQSSFDLPLEPGRQLAGSLNFRWRDVPPQADRPLAFGDFHLRAKADGGAEQFRARAACLQPAWGVAAFAVAENGLAPNFGIRYTTPAASVGSCLSPGAVLRSGSGVADRLIQMWAVGRHKHIYGGFHVEVDPTDGKVHDYQSAVSFRVDSPTRKGTVSEAVLRLSDRCSTLTAAYFQHLVVQRHIYNPFAPPTHVGIINYLDLGFEVAVRDFQGVAPRATLLAALQWQLNRNWRGKVVASNRTVGAEVGLKVWWMPRIALTASVVYDVATHTPKVGVAVSVETVPPTADRHADPGPPAAPSLAAEQRLEAAQALL